MLTSHKMSTVSSAGGLACNKTRAGSPLTSFLQTSPDQALATAEQFNNNSATDTSWLASADLTIADGPGAGPDLIGFEDFYDGKHQSLLAAAATPLAPPTSGTGQGFSWPNSIEQLQNESLIPDPGSASQTTDSGTGSERRMGRQPQFKLRNRANRCGRHTFVRRGPGRYGVFRTRRN